MQIEIALFIDYDEITDSYFVKGGMNLERGKLVLEREFSELGALQSAHTIRYCCESDESGCEFSLWDGCKLERWRAKCTGSQGELLLRFLFENAVSRENWIDILQDCMEYV